MADDVAYLKRLEHEVDLLRQLQKEVNEATSRADERIDNLRKEIEKKKGG